MRIPTEVSWDVEIESVQLEKNHVLIKYAEYNTANDFAFIDNIKLFLYKTL